MVPRTVIVLVPLVLLAAGCIAPASTEDGPLSTFLRSGPGEMTASESTEESDGLNPSLYPPFYAERVVRVGGVLTLDALPVVLATVQGDVEVVGGAPGVYELVVTMRGYGPTPSEAADARDSMTLTWSHESASGHELDVRVDFPSDDGQTAGLVGAAARQRVAHVSLTLPPDVRLLLDASTTNGDVRVAEVRADRLSLSTTNGDVEADGVHVGEADLGTTNGDVRASLDRARRVAIATTNGDVEATIVPSASGAVHASTTNGDVSILVPEDGSRGYRASLSTVNGEASVTLRDGSSRSVSRGAAEFETSGFGGRDIRTTLQLQAVNGDVDLGPA